MKRSTTKKSRRLRRLLYWLTGTFVVLFTLVVVFYFVTKVHIPEVHETDLTKMDRNSIGEDSYEIGRNYLKKIKPGMFEMYLEGSPYEIGVVNGKLTSELNFFQEKAFVDQIKILVPSRFVVNKLKYFIGFFNRNLEDHIPLEYRKEIYGISQFASDSFDFVAPKYHRMLNYHAAHDIGHAVQDKNLNTGCTSFIVNGKRSGDGKLLLGRNFDFYSGDSFAKNKIICFVKPQKGYKYAYITWAGFTGIVSGMNDQGLCITINASKSEIPSSAKTPISLLVKEILQYASNLKEAKAIAAKRETFVSESLLIASAKDKDGLIIEKSPGKTGYYGMNGTKLICPNHYQSDVFKEDPVNLKNIEESSSFYRLNRMDQLIEQKKSISVNDAATILRNPYGMDEQKIGLGNEKCINQLICHHAVIMQPENLIMHVSSGPYNLGEFMSFDLKNVFSTKDHNYYIPAVSIDQDTFLQTEEYLKYVSFRKLKQELNRSERYSKKIIEETISSNPNYYYTYQLIADYCCRFNKFASALFFYKKAAGLEIATGKERDYIEERITFCRKILTK